MIDAPVLERVRQNLSQKDVAQKMGVSVSTISRMEDSADVDLRIGDLMRYASILGFKISLMVDNTA
ncbi:MAG: helix-turn-helix transcriptional regulator [Kiritimatiellae bacterium]|nr:helix-turn-helix transcriptional regulator [Kiritimatiellia bacterium]